MSGYKGIILNRSQEGQWKDTLFRHGIEVTQDHSFMQEDENSRVKECLISIRFGSREISAIEYVKKDTQEKGIVFLHKERKDIEFIDMIISVLSNMA
jgi:head-tail adaptor